MVQCCLSWRDDCTFSSQRATIRIAKTISRPDCGIRHCLDDMVSCQMRQVPRVSSLTSLRFGWIVLISAELVAITHVFHFDFPANDLIAAQYPASTLSFSPNIAPGILILAFVPVILILNLLPVRQFGQMEYICGTIKMLFVIFMIVLNTVLHSLQRVEGEKLFWTYNSPYGPAAQNISLADGTVFIPGAPGRLAGMW